MTISLARDISIWASHCEGLGADSSRLELGRSIDKKSIFGGASKLAHNPKCLIMRSRNIFFNCNKTSLGIAKERFNLGWRLALSSDYYPPIEYVKQD